LETSKENAGGRSEGAGKLLEGKRALVTGGGTNIGKGIARRLLEEGAAVTIASRRLDVLEAAAEELERDVAGAEVHVATCDVTKPEEVERAVAEATLGSGRLDIAVANAGGGSPNLFLDADESQWRAELDLNLIGTVSTFRFAALAMKEAGGALVATSSEVAVSPALGGVPYTCAKAAVDMLVQASAMELGPLGIRVNAVRPGSVISTEKQPEPPKTERTKAAIETFMAQILDNTVLGRLGTPADIADTVLHLVGPSGSWITGQCFTVDGGASLHFGDDMRELAVAMREEAAAS
jgi:NAD(P)-dependent dehydrogenase (short-subunit alcohol dehydrogenase family)